VAGEQRDRGVIRCVCVCVCVRVHKACRSRYKTPQLHPTNHPSPTTHRATLVSGEEHVGAQSALGGVGVLLLLHLLGGLGLGRGLGGSLHGGDAECVA